MYNRLTVYKQKHTDDLALKNLKWLICHLSQQNLILLLLYFVYSDLGERSESKYIEQINLKELSKMIYLLQRIKRELY